ncbi:MAG TPA: outer membrane beta-barrel protein [Burkholderiales bacterium]
MNNKGWVVTLAGLALAGAVASPAAAQDVGFYLGGSLGQAEASGLCSDLNILITGIPGGNGTLASCDEKDSGFKLFGGYRVNRNFAVEGSYFDYGSFRANGQTFGVPFRVSGDATAWGFAALGILPVGERFSLFGKAGLLMTDMTITGAGVGGAGTEDESDSGLHIGVGAMFNLTRNFGIRAEWERNDEAEIDMLSLGLQVRF